MRLWLRDYRRRHPHRVNAAYRAAIARELENCGDLLEAMPFEDEAAAPVGVNTEFRLPASPGRPPGSVPGYAIKPYWLMCSLGAYPGIQSTGPAPAAA